MIETVENAVQLLITGACAVYAAVRAAISKRRAWTLLALASGVYFAGDLYWQLYLLFYDRTPQYSYISYLSWYACYLFLLMLVIEVRGARPAGGYSKILWCVPVFTVGMCVFYVQWGDWIGNIVTAALMTLLIGFAADALLIAPKNPDTYKKARGVCAAVLVFCAAEYAAWTASCFWMGDTIANPYFWFDMLLSAVFPALVFLVRKAVDR